MPFIRAYPREGQEMLFDAHAQAFAFFRGACTRGAAQRRAVQGLGSARGDRTCSSAACRQQ
jgi:hypothetical protein